MNRNRTWWSLALVVLGTLWPLLALGCESAKRTYGPVVFSEDRTGTVEWLLKKPN